VNDVAARRDVAPRAVAERTFRTHDGLDLTRGPVRILDDGTPPPPSPAWSTRVGLRAGEGDLDEWRCYIAGDPHLSRNNPGRARPRKSPAT